MKAIKATAAATDDMTIVFVLSAQPISILILITIFNIIINLSSSSHIRNLLYM